MELINEYMNVPVIYASISAVINKQFKNIHLLHHTLFKLWNWLFRNDTSIKFIPQIFIEPLLWSKFYGPVLNSKVHEWIKIINKINIWCFTMSDTVPAGVHMSGMHKSVVLGVTELLTKISRGLT